MAEESKRRRVVWTDSEVQRLALCVIDLRQKNPRLTLIRAVDTAQKILLEPDRHRFINTLRSVAKVEEVLMEIRKNQERLERMTREAQVEREQAAAAQPIEPEPEPENVTPEGEPPAEAEAQPDRPSMEDLLVHACAGFLERVAVEFVRRLSHNADILGALASIQGRTIELPTTTKPPQISLPVYKHNPLPQGEDRDRPPTVLVCGLKSHQQSAALTAINGRLNLKFWYAAKPNEGINTLREKAKVADKVLVITEATSHTAVNTIESMGKKVVRITGGGTTLNTVLDALAKDYGR